MQDTQGALVLLYALLLLPIYHKSKHWVLLMAWVQLQRSKFVTKMTSLNNIPPAGTASPLIHQLITFHYIEALLFGQTR